MRTGWFRQVQRQEPAISVVALASDRASDCEMRSIECEMRSIENVARAILREAGIAPGRPSRAVFADRVRELAGSDALVLLAMLTTMLRELALLTKHDRRSIKLPRFCAVVAIEQRA